jgi:hypothetical protein
MEATINSSAQAAEVVLLATDTLRGDVRDGLLTLVQTMETPWSKLSERDQQWRIDAIAKLSEKVVRQAVQIVANNGFPHVAMRTGKWNVGDGIKLEVSGAASVENITRLAEHGQGECILVLCEVGEFFGERRTAQPEPDQRKMDLDSEVVDGVPEMDVAARNAAMIRNATSLAGITVDLGQFPPDQRAGLADKITAAGGRWFNSDAEPEGETEAPAPEKPTRARRRTIRETEAA